MIVITGASQGIGNYLFEKYIENSVDVIGTYNSSTIAKYNSSSMFKVDITDINQVKVFFNEVANRLDNLTLINCAGINYNSLAHKANIAMWRDVINVNLIGTFNMIHYALIPMRTQNFGRIVNFSSVVAKMGIQGTSAYAASKSALWGLTKALAAENASKGITVNNINLGYFDVGMIREVPISYKEQIKSRIPINNELGNPINIFETINYIIRTPYLTGASIDLNGGIL